MGSEGCCKFCGRENEGNPGDYYHYHDCWRRDVLRRLDVANDRGDEAAVRELREELERASYVGD